MIYDMIVIGAGAAGVFGAIAAKTANRNACVRILEKTSTALSKVKISGGGRCNVTHYCFEPKELIKNYPRGHKELLGPFFSFGPHETVEWFAKRGVSLKKEPDGRMFPVTDSSQTIIDCLKKECATLGIDICYQQKILSIEKENGLFKITLENQPPVFSKTLLMATGSSPQGHQLVASLGHTITKTVPSLFTFNIDSFSLSSFSGVSFEDALVSLKNTSFSQRGPLLITHFGFSGPSVIKLSAWAARHLAEKNYQHAITINWIPSQARLAIQDTLVGLRSTWKTKQISTESPWKIPKQLWKFFCEIACHDPQKKWADLSKNDLNALVELLTSQEFFIHGKSTHKEEFVTCGGVLLEEICFKSMESKRCPGLFFAGEILDIDGVTGGFNFQNAWTGSYIAGFSANRAYFSS